MPVKAPLVAFTELLAQVRRDFYKGKPDKVWFSQQWMVKKALFFQPGG